MWLSEITERDSITSGRSNPAGRQMGPASIRDNAAWCADGGLEDTYTQVRLAWDQMMDERGVK